MLFAPLRIFLRVGLPLAVFGLCYGVISALITGRGVPTGAVGVTLGGGLTCFFGLIADQISQMRLAGYDQPIYRIRAGRAQGDVRAPDRQGVP